MARRPSPRSVWLVITSFLLGPPIGGVAFVATTLVVSGFVSGPEAPIMSAYWPAVLSAAYVLGTVPAIVGAFVMIYLTPRLPRLAQRLAAAPIVGALLSLLVGSVLFPNMLYGLGNWPIIGLIAISGAVPGFCCLAIVEYFHPLPKPAEAS